mmetsp:Transcript_6753/g.20059  ORF Transcript_6753/g.20059 Transcript_6753/m.20059 type:complete len:297 (+) Transcript_6753:1614-2504(+)
MVVRPIYKEDGVVEHDVWLVCNRARGAPLATKFGRICNDVAVGADRSRLELLVPINLEVVVVFIPQRLIVVVDSTVSAAVVGHQEVVRDVAWHHVRSSLAGALDPKRCDVRLPVPRVDRAVVRRLATAVEDEILVDLVTAARAVVEVEPSPRQVEAQVANERGGGRLGLEEARRLLLPDPGLAHDIALDQSALRDVALCGVPAVNATVGELVRLAPRRDGRATCPREMRVGDFGGAVVPREHEGVAVVPLKGAVVDGEPGGPLDVHGPESLERPVAARRHAVGIHVRRGSIAETDV